MSVINFAYTAETLCTALASFNMLPIDHLYDPGRFLCGWSTSPLLYHILQSSQVYADPGMQQSSESPSIIIWRTIRDCNWSHNDAALFVTGLTARMTTALIPEMQLLLIRSPVQ